MTIKEPTKIAGVRYLTGIACAQHELRLQMLKLMKRIEYRLGLAHDMANEGTVRPTGQVIADGDDP